MIGLDSTALIDLFREDKAIIKLLREVEDEVILNQISYLEIAIGIDFDNVKYKKEEEFYEKLFNSYQNLNLNILSSKIASRIFFELRKIGKIIELFDCAIAGIYLANGINKIITKNIKHFENIKGLKVISY